MATGGGRMSSEKSLVVETGPLVTSIVKLKEPNTVGVPLKTPPLVRLRPAGRLLPASKAQE